MAFEVEIILRFEEPPPTKEEIEDELDCVVIEWVENEV